MNKLLSKYFALFILLIIGFSALANDLTHKSIDSDRNQTPVQSTENYPETFLWKIERKGIPTSYLLGTIHIGKEESQLPERVLSILSQTNALMTESNLLPDEHDKNMLLMLLFEHNKNTTLSAKLGKKNFSKLSNYIGNTLPPELLEQFKPASALMFILYSRPEGYSETNGIDMLLTNEAIAVNKTRIFLESTEESLNLILSLPEEKVIPMIASLLDNQKELQDQSVKVVDYYVNNQVNELLKMNNDHEKIISYFPKNDQLFWEKWFFDDLLIKRNKKWLPILKQQIDKESTLIAVGALHLFGEDGLINALQKADYVVTPVMP